MKYKVKMCSLIAVIAILICWMLLLFEPYGMRLRQKVMSHFYPSRAMERAVFLYNKIIRRRESFIKFARRHVRRKFLNNKSGTLKDDTRTCLDLIRAKLDKSRTFVFVLNSINY